MHARTLQSVAAGALALGVLACGGAPHVGSPDATPPGPTPASTGSPSAPSVAAPGPSWPTYHAVGARTGAIAGGPPLGRVRRLWSAPVDSAVQAEPLVIGGRVIVATENDSVYAFDAVTGRRQWGVHLGAPVPGSSLPCGNLDPSGITGTPVADPRSGVIYVVIYRLGFRHDLVALDLNSGGLRWKRPIDPPGGDFTTEQQRAALLLSRGRVYISYGGLYGDCGRYHGWVVGAPTSGPSAPLISYQVPSQNEGAIWAPSGPAVDPAGNLYVATGNGSSSSFDYGNAVIRLTPELRFTSFFAPSDAGALNATDTDLGSTGPVLLPGSRAFIVGKSGVGYLISTRDLGGLGHPLASISLGPAFGGDAYADGQLYVPTTGGIAAVGVAGDRLTQLWRQGAATLPPIVAGPGIWALGANTLYQLDPHTGEVTYQAPVDEPAHFATPAAGGGRIYVAAGGRVQAFG